MNNQIIDINKNTISSVAKLHKELFPDHLLGMLQVKTIEKFYHSYLNNKEIVFIGAKDMHGNLSSFILGGGISALNNAKKEFIRNHPILFAVSIIKSWKAIKMFVNAYICKKKNERKILGELISRDYTLLSIGTANKYKGQGLSLILLEEFEKRLKMLANNKPLNYGLSVHLTNSRAIGFYHKTGFMDCYEEGGLLYLIKKI